MTGCHPPYSKRAFYCWTTENRKFIVSKNYYDTEILVYTNNNLAESLYSNFLTVLEQVTSSVRQWCAYLYWIIEVKSASATYIQN